MEAVGGPQTYVLGGALNCGKAQPGQVAAVSHGCPSALFRGVRILNTTEEGRPDEPVDDRASPQRLVEHALETSHRRRTASRSSTTPPAPTCAGPTTP